MTNAEALLFKILAREKMKYFVRMDGSVDGAAFGQDPFMNMLKNVFIYNACSKVDDCFAAKFNAFKEGRIDGSCQTNMLTLAVYDVGNNISRLRGFQKHAMGKTLEKFPKKFADTIGIMVSPCRLRVENLPSTSETKSQLSKKKATCVLKADLHDELRDWPVIPPHSDPKTHDTPCVSLAVSEDECIQILMLRELNLTEIQMWDLAGTMDVDMTPHTPREVLAIMEGETAKSALDAVHDMHRTVTSATKEWDNIHPSIKDELAMKLRILLTAFAS